MLKYKSSLQNNPPVNDEFRGKALTGLTAPSPFTYTPTHEDVYRGLGQQQAVDFDVAATKANTDYQMKQQDSQRQLALQGLQAMADAEKNDQDLVNNRLQMMYGTVGNLLQGLFN